MADDSVLSFIAKQAERAKSVSFVDSRALICGAAVLRSPRRRLPP
jgi:hypothetical protein